MPLCSLQVVMEPVMSSVDNLKYKFSVFVSFNEASLPIFFK